MGNLKGIVHATSNWLRFAYVDIAGKEAMEVVISRSEEALDGRNLLIKDGKSFEGRPLKKTQRYHVKSTTSVPSNKGTNAQ